jgi:hypothetical protein
MKLHHDDSTDFAAEAASVAPNSGEEGMGQ